MSLTRRGIITLLKDRNPPIKPCDPGYQGHIESAILLFFRLAKENLKEPAKFISYCQHFASDAKTYYSKESSYDIDVLLGSTKRKRFLDANVKKPDVIEVKVPKRSHAGAPKKDFNDKRPTGQYLEARDLNNYASSSGAVFKAAKLCADKEGMKDVSFVYKEVINNPDKATEMRKAVTSPKQGLSIHFTVLLMLHCFSFYDPSLPNNYELTSCK